MIGLRMGAQLLATMYYFITLDNFEITKQAIITLKQCLRFQDLFRNTRKNKTVTTARKQFLPISNKIEKIKIITIQFYTNFIILISCKILMRFKYFLIFKTLTRTAVKCGSKYELPLSTLIGKPSKTT